MLDWFTEPLQYEFMTRAILVSAFTGVVCACLSCFMTLKRWSLVGDAVSHSVLPGVVLSFILGIPFGVGAFVFGLAAVLLMGFLTSHTKVKEDAVIGIVFTGFFALGLVLISRTPTNVDLQHVLFGNVLGISNADTLQTLILGAITLVAIAVLRRDLLLYCFDPTHARSIGINVRSRELALLVLLSLTIVAALQTVGIILVISMLIAPGSIGFMLSERFDRMMAIAIAAAVASCVLGAYASYHLDVSTGGAIVVIQTALFLLVVALAPRGGLVSELWRRRRRAGARRGLAGDATAGDGPDPRRVTTG